MGNDYESTTDYDSRPDNTGTEHADLDNLAFINENDEDKLGNYANVNRDNQNIQLEEVDPKNAEEQVKRKRKEASAQKPNGSAVQDYIDNNLNQNNSTTSKVCHGNEANNPNGYIPNQPTNRSSAVSFSSAEPPKVSIISGHRVPDSRQMARPKHSGNQQIILPVMRVNSNGHTIRPDLDPEVEEVTML